MNDIAANHQRAAFRANVADRFGVLPNFFCSASAAPGLIERLWGFAQSAYLDSPLPSLFKERLFVHLSQFCPVRYCIVRHVGFLIGAGRPAGDATATAETVAEVLSLLQRPVPDSAAFDRAVSRLLDHPVPEEIPAPATPFEYELFDVLTILFLAPLASGRAREAMRAAVGETNFEYLIAYLAFIRAAHYWTETHPDIEYEPDMLQLMERHEELARLLLDPADADQTRGASERATALIALRESEERFRAVVDLVPDLLWRIAPSGTVVWHNDRWHDYTGQASHADTGQGWMDDMHPEDRDELTRALEDGLNMGSRAHANGDRVLAALVEGLELLGRVEVALRERRVLERLPVPVAVAVGRLDLAGRVEAHPELLLADRQLERVRRPARDHDVVALAERHPAEHRAQHAAPAVDVDDLVALAVPVVAVERLYRLADRHLDVAVPHQEAAGGDGVAAGVDAVHVGQPVTSTSGTHYLPMDGPEAADGVEPAGRLEVEQDRLVPA